MAIYRRTEGTRKMIPYIRHNIDNDDVDAVTEILKSDWLTGGPAVEKFEHDLSDLCGCDDVVVVNSGTAALHCAYYACAIKPGDDIVTSPLTFVATVAAAVHLGAIPRFVDVDNTYLTIDTNQLADVVGSQTKVITAVDYAGHPCDFDTINAIAERNGSVVVEDAAHSLGASLNGSPVGSLTTYTTLSFHPVKSITTGEGGALCINSPGNAKRAQLFRNHGAQKDPSNFELLPSGPWHQEVHEFGFNYRMPDILAALGSSQLKRLSTFVNERRKLAHRYNELLGDVLEVQLPAEAPNVLSAWHLYPLRIKNGQRLALYEALRDAGFQTQVHYLPIHLNPAFQKFDYKKGMFPVAERAYEELISLPLFPGLTQSNQDQIVEIVSKIAV